MSFEIEKKLYKKGSYRPEIDGLRAFAVVAVIINHFNKDILPGGYLGVDVFFIISGFVITSSLYQRPSKNFKDFIYGFYERRIKRLVPALSVFVLITSISICLFNPNPILSLKTGITSLFGLSNIYLLKQSADYFAQSTELNVFTHTWSLGVEEQFYILFPFLIWFSGFGRQTKNGARNLFLIVGALTVASLIGFFYLYPINQSAAYYLMPTRFWEMASGCCLFIALQKNKYIEQLLEKVPPLLILILIVGAMYIPMSFAAISTLAVVFLSAVLIASLKEGTKVFTFFVHKKVVYIGLISYSLYLWHWAILSISRWTIGIHWWSVPFQLAIILGFAICSYRYIEIPLRKGIWFEKRWKTVVVSGGVIFTLSVFLMSLGEPLKGILYLGKKEDLSHLKYGGLLEKKCTYNQKFDIEKINLCSLSSTNGRQILSIGDSQTWHLIPLLVKLHNDDGFGIYYYSSNGINFPSLTETRSNGINNPNLFREKYKNTLDHFNYYFSQLKSGDIIILSSRYELRWGNRPIPRQQRNLKFTYYDSNNKILSRDESYKRWNSLFENIAEKSVSKGIKIIILNSIPTFPNNFILQDKQWFNSLNNQNNLSFIKRDYLLDNSKLVDSAFNSLENKYLNVEVFDIFSLLCPKSNIFCSNEKYKDQWHLSKEGAISLYEGLLKKINLSNINHK